MCGTLDIHVDMFTIKRVFHYDHNVHVVVVWI